MRPSRLDTRLRRLEAQFQATDEAHHGQRLASLLAEARRSPAEACDLDEALDVETPPTGLARLLWDIRHGHAEKPLA